MQGATVRIQDMIKVRLGNDKAVGLGLAGLETHVGYRVAVEVLGGAVRVASSRPGRSNA